MHEKLLERDSPQEKNNFDWIKAIEGNPNKLLRVLPIDAETPEQFSESLEILKRGRELFEYLHMAYGIHVPRMDIAVQKDSDGLTKAFTLVDRIEGVDVADTPVLPIESAQAFDQFYGALARHYGDVLEHGGDFWFDFRNDQLMYGHIHGQKENAVYISDVDPEYQVYDPKTKRQGSRLLKLIHRVYESVLATARKISPMTRFDNARQALEEIVQKIPVPESRVAA